MSAFVSCPVDRAFGIDAAVDMISLFDIF